MTAAWSTHCKVAARLAALVTLRIVVNVREDGTTIRLIDRMRAEHVEREGVVLQHCAPLIREWMFRESKRD